MKQNWRFSFLITHARYTSSPFTEGCDPTAQQLKHSPSFLGSAGIQTIPLPWGYVKVPHPLPKHVALLFRRSWHILLCLDYDQGVRVSCLVQDLKSSWKATSISDLWKPGKNPNLYNHPIPIWWGNQPQGKGNSTGLEKQRHWLMHNMKTIPGSQSNTEMGIDKSFETDD